MSCEVKLNLHSHLFLIRVGKNTGKKIREITLHQVFKIKLAIVWY